MQPPDFEAPADAGHDNVYDVIVELMEGTLARDSQTLHVTGVGDVRRTHARRQRPRQRHRCIARHGGFFATAEEDLIRGAAGNDKLSGLGGNDLMLGGTGSDTLIGGSGNDHLDGGGGKDRLFGGAGNDCFRFASRLVGANADLIADFARGADKIMLEDAISSLCRQAIRSAAPFTSGSQRLPPSNTSSMMPGREGSSKTPTAPAAAMRSWSRTWLTSRVCRSRLPRGLICRGPIRIDSLFDDYATFMPNAVDGRR